MVPSGGPSSLSTVVANYLAHCGIFAEGIVSSLSNRDANSVVHGITRHLQEISNFAEVVQHLERKDKVKKKAMVVSQEHKGTQTGEGELCAEPPIKIAVTVGRRVCSSCGKSFSSDWRPKNHETICSVPVPKRKNHACQFCAHQFTRKDNLKAQWLDAKLPPQAPQAR